MQRVPDAVFVIDLKTEAIAVREAQRLRLPIIGLVDTNCDPDGIDYVIPGNDDAIRSCSAVTKAIGDVVAQGHRRFRAEEERARREAEEQERREAEERARREAEEQAQREAEEARREAEAVAAAEQAERASETPPDIPSPSAPAPSEPEPESGADRTRVGTDEEGVQPTAGAPEGVQPEGGAPDSVEVPPASAPQPPAEAEQAPAQPAGEEAQ